MDQKFHTSFIPKKALAPTSAKKQRRGTVNIFFLGAFIIFLGTLLLAVGVFLYQEFLTSSIERKQQSLEKARAEFEPAFIQEISRFDSRINSAKTILERHLALSALFKLLEAKTLKSIQFEGFSYLIEGDGRINIFMKGKARSFSSIALQSDIFGKDKFIKEPIFSNLNLDQKGNAIFDFSAFIDRDLLSYANQQPQNLRPDDNVSDIILDN
jgi:hypothetical protein